MSSRPNGSWPPVGKSRGFHIKGASNGPELVEGPEYREFRGGGNGQAEPAPEQAVETPEEVMEAHRPHGLRRLAQRGQGQLIHIAVALYG